MAKVNYTQGNYAWLASLAGKIVDVQRATGIHRDSVRKARELERDGRLDGVTPEPIAGVAVRDISAINVENSPHPITEAAQPLTPSELVAADRAARVEQSTAKQIEAKYKTAITHIEEREQQLAVFQSFGDPSAIRPIPLNKSINGGQAAAIAQATDWHVEERVERNMVNGLNEYNPDIARKRAGNFFGNLLKLVRNQRRDVTVKTLILHLGGDLITGYIHEELEESNFMSPTQAMLFAQELIVGGIKRLANDGEFDQIRVVCNYGNHGRTTKKIRVSTGHHNSYEWMMYKVMAAGFAGDPVVQFQVADAYCEYVEVFGYTLRFHHGDAIKYGGGIGGLTIPLLKYVHRLNGQRRADGDFIGHFHQLTPYNRASKFGVNGSLIGFGPYAQRIGASPEPPLQNFQLLDAARGFTVHAPIFVED